MMKVTKSTFNEIASNRRKNLSAKKPMVQKMNRDGSWGKPFVFFYGTAEDAVEKLEAMNPGKKFRLA